jgi:glutathione peroxidase
MRKIAWLAVVLVLVAAPPAGAEGKLDWAKVPLPAIDGTTHPANLFQNKVVLLVNTASFCGYTGQYEDLQKLWRRYRDKGFVVLGVPANDFGAQEPGSNAAIKSFCTLNYGVDFPLLEKQTVAGADAHPLFRWAAAQTGPAGVPRWNFHKILIGRDGSLLAWFSTPTPPLDAKITKAVAGALAAPAHGSRSQTNQHGHSRESGNPCGAGIVRGFRHRVRRGLGPRLRGDDKRVGVTLKTSAARGRSRWYARCRRRSRDWRASNAARGGPCP